MTKLPSVFLVSSFFFILSLDTACAPVRSATRLTLSAEEVPFPDGHIDYAELTDSNLTIIVHSPTLRGLSEYRISPWPLALSVPDLADCDLEFRQNEDSDGTHIILSISRNGETVLLAVSGAREGMLVLPGASICRAEKWQELLPEGRSSCAAMLRTKDRNITVQPDGSCRLSASGKDWIFYLQSASLVAAHDGIGTSPDRCSFTADFLLKPIQNSTGHE
jgi:hypothetical protein